MESDNTQTVHEIGTSDEWKGRPTRQGTLAFRGQHKKLTRQKRPGKGGGTAVCTPTSMAARPPRHETGQRHASTATPLSRIVLPPRKARLGKEKSRIPSDRASEQRGSRAEVGVAGKPQRWRRVAGGKLGGLEDARTRQGRES